MDGIRITIHIIFHMQNLMTKPVAVYSDERRLFSSGSFFLILLLNRFSNAKQQASYVIVRPVSKKSIKILVCASQTHFSVCFLNDCFLARFCALSRGENHSFHTLCNYDVSSYFILNYITYTHKGAFATYKCFSEKGE